MDKKTVQVIAVTLLVVLVIGRTSLGNSLLGVEKNYFK